MRRSDINRYLREATQFLDAMHFYLPPFAFWSPADWETKGREYDEIRENQLGWDITDFGSGIFGQIGLLLFTIRNGNVNNPDCPKTYAEKILIVRPGQLTPYHYHRNKMEDIINRGGGILEVQVYDTMVGFSESGPVERAPDYKSQVPVAIDGRNFYVKPGGIVSLEPGESISLLPGVFHQFWSKSALLLGEVSMVNDDEADNVFLEDHGRFPKITEDEPPLHLLAMDYRPEGKKTPPRS
jgi:D-lyxose ketol-isomerase